MLFQSVSLGTVSLCIKWDSGEELLSGRLRGLLWGLLFVFVCLLFYFHVCMMLAPESFPGLVAEVKILISAQAYSTT